MCAQGELATHTFVHPTTTHASVTVYWRPTQSTTSTTTSQTTTASTKPTTTTTPPKLSLTPAKPAQAGSSVTSLQRGTNHLKSTPSSLLQSRAPKRRVSNFTTPFKNKSEPDTKRPRTIASTPSDESTLEALIRRKEATLAELQHKKRIAEEKFSSKEEQDKVDELIVKWREVCQAVLQELLAKANNAAQASSSPEASVTMEELLVHVGLDPELVRFSITEDKFLEG
eukprot:TRINITY_DN7955_c0_g2_i2.p1 TRINITY_DN7955_c0_g2~~TRINITY_DN7955_c0_g2_i2.p1  ORF type:complete len:227 (-),score=57.85 TRINITY_DN7955_c0_g2_i2:113-793(-)